MKAASTIKTHADSTRQAPPPYSDFPGVVENSVSWESLPQLLDSRNKFQIQGQVYDENGTLLLSVLRQPLSQKDWWTRNIFLNSTGRPVMEMKSTADGKDTQIFDWTIYEGGRVLGMLRYFSDKSKLVGYRISGEEMFRIAEDGTVSWTVTKDGKDLAVISKGDKLYTTSLAISNKDEEFEVKALLLCSALYYDSVCLKVLFKSSETPEKPQTETTRPSTISTSRQTMNCWMCCRDTMQMITILLLVLVPAYFIFLIFKGLVDKLK